MHRYKTALVSIVFSVGVLASSAQADVQYSLSMFGDTKYGKDFQHFDYVNPDAPKRGKVVMAGLGTFDSFNPYTAKDEPPTLIGITGVELMTSSDDEPFSKYPYLAESVERIGKNEGIVFNLNPKARFSDGSPVTAEDAVVTFNYLRTQGRPLYAAYYRDVEKVEAIDKDSVRFTFKNNENRELALILGDLPVLKASEINALATQKEKKPFTGLGPYRVKEYKMGQYVVYERVKDFWGQNLPALTGKYNFDEIRVDFYRDEDVVLEAFKSGRVDYILENSAKRWATAYVGDKFDSKDIQKIEQKHRRPAGIQAFAFNTRHSLFTDPRVREALGYAYDFEWANSNLFYGTYTRTNSYFANSDCASGGLPEGDELALLDNYREKLPDRVFKQVFSVPTTKGDGNVRENLRKAVRLLSEAGWKIKDNKLVNTSNGQPFEFELLLYSQDFERIALPFKANLEKLGITMNVRVVDMSQYFKTIRSFNYDMIIHSFPQSVSPGNEQRDYWHSSLADQSGSQNVLGVKDPVVDALIEKLVNANNRAQQLSACRALDRVLLNGYYIIPQWYISVDRIAYWDKFDKPAINPIYNDSGFFNWWIKPTAQ